MIEPNTLFGTMIAVASAIVPEGGTGLPLTVTARPFESRRRSLESGAAAIISGS